MHVSTHWFEFEVSRHRAIVRVGTWEAGAARGCGYWCGSWSSWM